MYDVRVRLLPQQLPADLRSSSRWVVWKLESHEGRANCKIPYAALTGKRAASTEPDDWCKMEEALAASAKYNGVGLIIGPPFVAVDLDKCRDPQSGVIDQWASDLIAKLPATYTELSPSGKGFHLWFKGKAPKEKEGFRAPDLEVYFSKRYFTMSFDHVEGTPLEITPLDDGQLRELLAAVEARKPGKKTEVRESRTANQSEKMRLLMAGDYEAAGFGDVSAAVQSLLTLLAIEHLLDRDKVEAAFKASGLYRDFRPARPSNWIEKWSRLGGDELNKAIANAREVLAKIRERKKETKPELTAHGKVISMDAVEAKELTWLWTERVPRGNVTMFAGDPGIGKSLLALDLVGRGSRGLPFLDNQPCEAPFKSLLLMTEDDRETIIVPRLKVIEADLAMIKAIDMVEMKTEDGEVFQERMISLENDLTVLRKIITEDPAIQLIVVDPISNYMGNRSMFRDQEFRAVMMPMVKLAQDTGVSIITIMHNSKQVGRSALSKVGVALGGVGAARIGWSFIQKDDEVCQMLIMKKNLGNFAGIEYTTETAMLEIDGKQTKQARMKYITETTVSAENALTSQEDVEERKEKPATQFIIKEIPKGEERNSQLLMEAAEKVGISPKQLQRARSSLGLNTHKKRDGWWWSWPATETPREPGSDDEASMF